MNHDSTTDGGGGQTRQRETRATRRRFLRASAGAGVVVAGGVATGVWGSATGAVPLEPLSTDGNVVVDPNDNIVTLRGVNTIDPARAGGVDDYIRAATDESAGWYSTIVRIPMQPTDIGGHGSGAAPVPAFDQGQLDSYLSSYIDSAVATARQEGVYIILDYHRHWPEGPDWNDPALSDELELFWNTVAPRYANDDHVVYEVYNEPTTPDNGDPTAGPGTQAEQTWLDWRETAQPWVDTIRSHAGNLVLIGSPRWSQFTAQAPHNEFAGEDLVYVGHIYTQVTGDGLWEYFGTPSESVPVWMTEFGWSTSGSDHWIGTNDVEGQNFLDFYADHPHISWTAWCFDPNWGPPMLSHKWQANEYGEFIRQELEARQDEYHTDPAAVPGYDGGGTPTATEPACDAARAPDQVSGATPRDLDGDGLYMDVNGNCRLDNDDVVTYFEEMDSGGITNNVASYDYNRNGRIDFDDLVTLFETL